MGWTYLQLGDGEPVRAPAAPDVVAVFEARGFNQVDDPTEPGVVDTSVQVAEVDDHGQAWVQLEHPETGGQARFPLEAVEAQRELGWRPVGKADVALDDRTVAEL